MALHSAPPQVAAELIKERKRAPDPNLPSPARQVEAELVEERERAGREAERARQAIRQKEAELAAIEAKRKERVRSISRSMHPAEGGGVQGAGEI